MKEGRHKKTNTICSPSCLKAKNNKSKSQFEHKMAITIGWEEFRVGILGVWISGTKSEFEGKTSVTKQNRGRLQLTIT